MGMLGGSAILRSNRCIMSRRGWIIALLDVRCVLPSSSHQLWCLLKSPAMMICLSFSMWLSGKVRYVVIREGVGEVFCHHVYGRVVVAVIVYVQHGDRFYISGDLYPCNVSVLELDLFIAIY